MKKVIQIAISGHANTIRTQSDVTLVALCNDGTMWAMSGFGGEWLEELHRALQAVKDAYLTVNWMSARTFIDTIGECLKRVPE